MDWEYYIYLIILLLIVIAGIIRYKELTKAFKVLTILIIATLISESVKRIFGKIYHNSMPVAHLWAVLEYAGISIIYYHLLKSLLFKRMIIISLFVIPVLEIIIVICFQGLLQFPSVILNISQFIYVLYSLVLFRQMLLHPSEQPLFKQSIFWFNLNMLFFGTTMFLNFALTSYFIRNNLDADPLFYFSIVVNFIFYIVIGIVILIDNRKFKAINYYND